MPPQVAVRIAKGATPLDVAAAAMEAIASTKAGAKTVGTGVLTSAPLATGHTLIHAWLQSAESELVRQEETAKWEARVAEQAKKLTQVRADRQTTRPYTCDKSRLEHHSGLFL